MDDPAGIGFKIAALVTVTLVSLVGGFLPLRIHLVPEQSRVREGDEEEGQGRERDIRGLENGCWEFGG